MIKIHQDLQESVVSILVGVICYFALFFAIPTFIKFPKSLSQKEIDYAKILMTGTIFATFVSILGLYVIIVEQPSWTSNFTELSKTVGIFSTSYFIYDTIVLIMTGNATNKHYIHHFLALTASVMSLQETVPRGLLWTLVWAEISNPLMLTRKIMRMFGHQNTRLFEVLENLYLVTYIGARMGPLFYLSVDVLFQSNISLFSRILPMGIYLQSAMFVGRMFEIIKYNYEKYKERKEEGIELYWLETNPRLYELEYIKNPKSANIF